jgi:hypothetical protein
MLPNAITRGTCVRRGLALGAAVALSFVLLAGCGGDRDPLTSVPDKEADVEVINEVLARQLAAIDAYGEALPKLKGLTLAEARRFRAQEQEHVDATTKALRALNGEAAPPPETIEAGRLKNAADALHFLYEVESATIDLELSAVARLTGSWRSLLAAMVANQAQRLVLIRRALGAKPLDAVPQAFENGTTPAP